MKRMFRLEKRVWLHAMPGYHHRLWKKPIQSRYVLQQTLLADRGLSRTAERMGGNYYRRLDLRKFVDKPFSLYQPYLSKKETKFFP